MRSKNGTNCSSVIGPCVANQCFERDAVHQLHRDPGQAVLVFDPEGVDMSRVGMIEP